MKVAFVWKSKSFAIRCILCITFSLAQEGDEKHDSDSCCLYKWTHRDTSWIGHWVCSWRRQRGQYSFRQFRLYQYTNSQLLNSNLNCRLEQMWKEPHLQMIIRSSSKVWLRLCRIISKQMWQWVRKFLWPVPSVHVTRVERPRSGSGPWTKPRESEEK